MIKLRAPEGHTSMTIGGVPITVGRDGGATVPVELVPTLKSHGFADWAQAAARDSLDEAVELFRAHLKTLPPEEVRRAVIHYRERLGVARDDEGDDDLGERNNGSGETAPGFDPAQVRPEDIDGLKRPEMFALLKARGVAAAPTLTNDKLREIARDTLRRA